MDHCHSQEDGSTITSQVLQEIRWPFGKAVSSESTNGIQFLCFVDILRTQAKGLATCKPQANRSLSYPDALSADSELLEEELFVEAVL